ncbi:MAG TPA: hypothetical protein VJQ55_03040, partial [Candidatus Binatia bacterium]|nr:hypothetical protein [Candidatus Binatia bacterium]
MLQNGARVTGHSSAAVGDDRRRDIIFLGCSFTHGWGLNDQETFAWKVQAALPNWKVHNFGVNGYGTCQSYMLLNRLFERERWHNPVVIYGYIGEHEDRNVGYFLWHYALSMLTTRAQVSLPSCALDGSGAIVFNPPHPYPHFPFRYSLASVS